MSNYIWKVGEVALARICKKVYAKVKIVKNEEGLFHDEKVLAISATEDGNLQLTEQLCYHVEICRTGQMIWLPYTSLHLAERSRPFYGSDRPLGENVDKVVKTTVNPKKRKMKEDHILPLDIKPSKLRTSEPDLNMTYDLRHMPLKQNKYENAFREFVRRGKDMLFDEFYSKLKEDPENNQDVINYVEDVDASTEDKFEAVIKNFVTEKEMEHYLHKCWRYNFVEKLSIQNEVKEASDSSNSSSPTKPATLVHTSWCLVCGQGGRLKECPTCPSAFHVVCRREWLLTVIHRKNPPRKPEQHYFVKKVLSSTRTVKVPQTQTENTQICPSCMWGPTVGYDDVVWHKLGTCAWWPARVLPPGSTPSCLLSRAHTAHQYPLKYYGTENYSWGESNRMSLFLPSHTACLSVRRDPALKEAVLDACDDYIAVYLT